MFNIFILVLTLIVGTEFVIRQLKKAKLPYNHGDDWWS